MKLLLLSDANSIHTIKWAKSLFDKGFEIVIFSLNKADSSKFEGQYTNIKIHSLDMNQRGIHGRSGLSKLKYLLVLPRLKQLIKGYKPDIVHAHYATSYGLLGALSGFKPFVLSVWGSDVFDFPNKSIFHRQLLKYNLGKASVILSTSNTMAIETKKYTNQQIFVTPFGIDTNKFKKGNGAKQFTEDTVVIGTVKTLEHTYGIDYLLRATSIVIQKYPKLPIRVFIVGKGTQLENLKNLAKELNIDSVTDFVGEIKHEVVQDYLNSLSVYVALSLKESFGVAIIEASACEIPVVVSNVGGLPEVVEDGITGLVVPSKDYKAAAYAIERLILDSNKRATMGKAGRKRVVELYNWQNNVEQMISIYKDILQKNTIKPNI